MLLTALLLPLTLFQSGGKLQSIDTVAGKGQAVQVGDRVTVDYTGKLTDGKVFDSSIGKRPFSFVVGAGQVIQGWDKGLLGLKVGGQRKLTIPASLGYGAAGAPPDIPGGATLVFDITLKTIERVVVKTSKPGKGVSTKGGDTVSLHYTGKLADGTKFDSSVDRGEPFEVTIGRTSLIPGFTMGILGMKRGEKRAITIPPTLGYGDRAVGAIPAGSTLIFEIELLEVKK